MNQHLQTILNFIQQDESLTAEEKNALSKSLKDADKELEITAFKLDRTEKVKRTTAILLEETIEELEQKRKAVEVQNRELEIESSLERVRTVAMGMQHPDDLLSICEILFTELQKLGFSELRNTMINIHDDVKGSLLNHEFSGYAGKTITTIFYKSHPVVESHVKQIKSSHDAFEEIIFTGKELEDWRQFRKENGEQDDPKLGDIKALYYYFYSVVNGDIGISNFEPVSEKQLAVLKRFSNVFDLAYKRYSDITKAEAQAREAQIENALEKVRSRTMAMQRSEELPEAANNLFLQVQALGIPAWSAGYCIWDKDKQGITFWMSSEGVMQPAAHTPLTEDPSFIHMKEAYERGDAFHVEEVGGEALVIHYQYMRTLPVVGEILDSIIAAGHPLPTFQIFHCVYFSQGFLLFITYEAVPKAHDIFKRFGNVFEQTYTRFLDLKKAEAQAREATIEAALEKIRSRSLAMHRSEELKDVISIVFQKLNELKVLLGTVGIQLFDQKSMDSFFWVGNAIQDAQMVYLPYDKQMMLEDTFFKDGWHAMAEGRDIINKEYTHEQKNMYFEYLFANNDFTQIPETAREVIRQIKSHIICLMTEKNSALFADSWNGQLYSKENLDVLKRASRVFEQAYIRFLDLQKAETQAREATIETALEKVRSRSLAMHKSDELKEVVAVVFEKLKELDFSLNDGAVSILIFNESSNNHTQWIADPGQVYATSFEIDDTDHSLSSDIKKARETNTGYFSKIYSVKEKNEYFNYLFAHSEYKRIPDEVKRMILESEQYGISLAFEKNSAILIPTNSGRLLKENEQLILKRFAKVFEQSYTRFLDLQKAEAQSREAQIELALERVRSRSMAMHKSDEVLDVANTLYESLKHLDFPFGACTIMIMDKASGDMEHWVAGFNHKTYPQSYQVKYFNHPFYQAQLSSWKNGEKFTVLELAGDLKRSYDEVMFTETGYKNFPEEEKKWMQQGEAVNFSMAYMAHGALMWGPGKLSDDYALVLQRFAKVFEQTYTRFLDLQKAEAQAREAQIEAALEKVRSRSLAMHHSDELEQVVVSLFDRLVELGLSFDGACIFIFEKEKRNIWLWIATKHLSAPVKIDLPYDEDIKNNTIIKDLWNAIETSEHIFNRSYSGETKNDYFRYVAKHNESKIPESVRNFQIEAARWTVYFAVEKNSIIGFDSWSGHNVTSEDFQTLIRFARVFEQTYTRFLDLQKAEAQAREAQIEAALERVRARTMAMHKSEELREAAVLLYKELKSLRVTQFLNCGYVEINEENNIQHGWMTKTDGGQLEGYTIPLIGDDVLQLRYDAWKRKDAIFHQEVGGEKLKNHTEFTSPHLGSKEVDEMVKMQFPDPTIYYCGNFSHGYLHVITGTLLNAEDESLLTRFTRVFEMTYKRFLDLQKAEAQTREAQIEVSLERVRAQTMAMNKSQDLQEVVSVIFRELDKLDLKTIRCGIGIINGQTRSVNVWSTTTTKEGIEVNFSGNESMDIHPVLQGAFAGWQKQEDFYAILEGEVLTSYYDTQKGDNYKLPDAAAGVMVSEKDRQYYFCTYFPAGGIYFFRQDTFSDELVKLIRRFASAFSLAYKRFEDLKQSEARALEVIKESSLDRVRAETASMRTTADLERITPLIWNELTTLGVPFIRCGVFIIDDAQQQIHTFLSTPDGKAIAAFHLPYDTSEQITQVVIHWRQNKIYKDHWDEAAFDEWTNTLVEKGIIAAKEQYLTTSHPTNLHLHFLPFLQGMLYVGSDTLLSEGEIQLAQSLAGAFSTAYARYEDFNNLELAKQQIEKALVDLKQAQTQLIQSEKMASLGELTAGIAHEIQNPLNFVNNFSEVNTELIEEMKEEIDKGNLDDAKVIANDIKENEQKINHHGKRADAIVKGMLQHSRTSTATKEPTDINKLADEYLRLAYHGLRAKDKSFNATLKTDYDETLEKIDVIPQDIGRVILNLLTNAFYAVSEKQKAESLKLNAQSNYEPTVSVSTRKLNSNVEIKVSDNGNGIPEKIVDKIFQPFFTTKPTGQGTGLGLSLAYDIVKAHGGELMVETKEARPDDPVGRGEGSEFIIQLRTN